MTEKSERAEASLPKAKITKARPAWLLWLIPLAAAGLCVWFVFRDFVATGPALTVFFRDADGLEEGNTQVKYRGAQVGVVKHLDLTTDDKYVRVRLRLISSARNLARAGSVFWIVRPEVKVGGISGLRTIISGEYITVQPGNGPPTNRFVGAEKQPLPELPKSLHIRLLAPDISSLREQSPIFYRGIQVGEVQRYQLGNRADNVIIDATIDHEYAPLVQVNSKFWSAGGINFKFSLFHGAEINAESPEALLSGAIEFATPPEILPAATNGTVFWLYDKPENIWKEWRPLINMQLPERAGSTAPPPGVISKARKKP